MNYLAESALVQSPGLFTHYIAWLKVLLEGYKVSPEDLAINLNLIKETLEEEFDHPSKSLLSIIWIWEYIEQHKLESQAGYINESMPYGDACAIVLTVFARE